MSNRHGGHQFSLDQFLWKAVCTSKPAVSHVLQAGEQDIIAVTWSPTKASLVMALNSHSQLILLHINSQTCQPDFFDFGNTTSPSKGTKAAITVSSCLISAGKPFPKFSRSVHYWLRQLHNLLTSMSLQMFVRPCKALSEALQQNQQMMVIGFDNGYIECCLLQPILTSPQYHEEEETRKILKLQSKSCLLESL